MRPVSPSRAFWALLRHEFLGGLKGPLFWLALVCLLTLALPVHMAFGGDIVFQGRSVGGSNRMVVALGGGYTLLVFFSTLYALCLCLDRAGAHYLKYNDVLILSRALGRLRFCCAKILAVFLNTVLYGMVGLVWLWWELPRNAGTETAMWPILLIPLGLTTACVIAVYFALRNVLGNFLIFFVWLIALPLFFLTGLWHCFAEPLKGGLRVLLWLPQLGGLHAWALGIIHLPLQRPEASWALLNVALWLVAALTAGAWVFGRKRL